VSTPRDIRPQGRPWLINVSTRVPRLLGEQPTDDGALNIDFRGVLAGEGRAHVDDVLQQNVGALGGCCLFLMFEREYPNGWFSSLPPMEGPGSRRFPHPR